MRAVAGWEAAFSEWLEPFFDALGHKARRRWAPVYIRGLFGRAERKSVQPIATELAPGDDDRLHNLVASRAWDSAPLEAILAEKADALVGGPGASLVVDDVSLPKKGEHSVGVASLYAGVSSASALTQTEGTGRRLCEEIDERVKTFLGRPIEGDWPYLGISSAAAWPASRW